MEVSKESGTKYSRKKIIGGILIASGLVWVAFAAHEEVKQGQERDMQYISTHTQNQEQFLPKSPNN